MAVRTVTTQSEEETAAVGRELASSLLPGDVVLLSGDLGAGKTAFVRGLAEGLGVSRDEVSSPTFTLIQEYRGGRLPLFHVDLYRIEDPGDLEELGLDDARADSALLIEWPERMGAALWPDELCLHIERDGAARRLTWQAPAAWEGRWPPR